MTTSGPATTYRYVADGRLESELDRIAVGVGVFRFAALTVVVVGGCSRWLSRPTGVRTVPYENVFRVRPFRSSFLRVERRGRLVAELLPPRLAEIRDDDIRSVDVVRRGRSGDQNV